MIIVKITALLIVLSIIWYIFLKAFITGNFKEIEKLISIKEYFPWYLAVTIVFLFLIIIGVIASTIYLLFFE